MCDKGRREDLDNQNATAKISTRLQSVVRDPTSGPALWREAVSRGEQSKNCSFRESADEWAIQNRISKAPS